MVLALHGEVVQDGRIPDRGQIDDAALKLRDVLNPDYIEHPDWLPEPLASELGHLTTSVHDTTKAETASPTKEPPVDSNTLSESLLEFGQERKAAISRTTQLLAANRTGSRRQRQRRKARRRWM